jgi:hypothetical protein
LEAAAGTLTEDDGKAAGDCQKNAAYGFQERGTALQLFDLVCGAHKHYSFVSRRYVR